MSEYSEELIRHAFEDIPLGIDDLATLIPEQLLDQSGKVFYSGRAAFTKTSPLYLLGINPGGDPASESGTIRSHTFQVLRQFPDDWSAYRDESWKGKPPGTRGMAPRVLHVLRQLDLNPGLVPASNLVFARSRREGDISSDKMHELADACWPFHDRVIRAIRPRAILCLGSTAGNYVRKRLSALELKATLIERNDRKWRSRTFVTADGINVISATHPSIADWCSSAADITALVQQALQTP